MNRLIGSLKVLYASVAHARPPQTHADLDIHLHAALNWLLQAQSANRDGGMSSGYKLILGRWSATYPETTGYTIPTLLKYAQRFRRSDVRQAALDMTGYILAVQLPDGGIPSLQGRGSILGSPVAFDTGQVIFGLLSAYEDTPDARYLSAIERAAGWLTTHQLPDGTWKDYQSTGSLKAIDARVSWALIAASRVCAEPRFLVTARRQLTWVLENQHENGWFPSCSFSPRGYPVTHTIAYTIEGFLESGVLLSDDRLVHAAKTAADRLLEHLQDDGFLPGAFTSQWSPAVKWSCLTGSAQMSRVWLRFAEIFHSAAYSEAARRAIRFVARTQWLDGMPEGILGGIAGSWPIYGGYLHFAYPNWAANFFVDTLLTLSSEPAADGING